MSKLNYTEGDWFAVPLREGGFATGRIARMAPGGRVLLGYFFGPRRDEPPTLESVHANRASDAIMVRRFGDLYLVNGKWPVLGGSGDWKRQDWPIPAFGRLVEHDAKAWKVMYPDDNPNATPRETGISTGEYQKLPDDALLGAGVVEVLLTKALSGGGQR